MKNAGEYNYSRLDQIEDRINYQRIHRCFEITQSEMNKKKIWKRVCPMWSRGHHQMCKYEINWDSKRRRVGGEGRKLKEVITENAPNLRKL